MGKILNIKYLFLTVSTYYWINIKDIYEIFVYSNCKAFKAYIL